MHSTIISTPQALLHELKRVYKLKQMMYVCCLPSKLKNSFLLLLYNNNLIAGYCAQKKIKIKNQFVFQVTIALKYGPNYEQSWQNCVIDKRPISNREVKWLQLQNINILIQTSKGFFFVRPMDKTKIGGTLVALIT